MSNAIETKGITIKRGTGTGSPETFVSIAEITDFNGPDVSASEIDVTSLDSTAKEFRLGLKDNGSFSFNALLVPQDSAQQGLQTDMDNRTLRNFEIVLPKQDSGSSAGTTYEFSAYVTQFAISGGIEQAMTCSCTLRISGDITKTHEA